RAEQGSLGKRKSVKLGQAADSDQTNPTFPPIRRVVGAVRPQHGSEFNHRTVVAATTDQTRQTRRAWIRLDGLVELEFDHRMGVVETIGQTRRTRRAWIRPDGLVELEFDQTDLLMPLILRHRTWRPSILGKVQQSLSRLWISLGAIQRFAASNNEEECEVPLAGFEESPILREEDGIEETEDLLPVLESRESMTDDQNSCHESLVEPKLDESVWSNPSSTSPSSLISNYCGAREVVERR
ncbi:hypothetical protein CRG98_022260, partial [Punica granatum]